MLCSIMSCHLRWRSSHICYIYNHAYVHNYIAKLFYYISLTPVIKQSVIKHISVVRHICNTCLNHSLLSAYKWHFASSVKWRIWNGQERVTLGSRDWSYIRMYIQGTSKPLPCFLWVVTWQFTIQLCLMKYHTTCDFSCGICPMMVIMLTGYKLISITYIFFAHKEFHWFLLSK